MRGRSLYRNFRRVSVYTTCTGDCPIVYSWCSDGGVREMSRPKAKARLESLLNGFISTLRSVKGCILSHSDLLPSHRCGMSRLAAHQSPVESVSGRGSAIAKAEDMESLFDGDVEIGLVKVRRGTPVSFHATGVGGVHLCHR